MLIVSPFWAYERKYPNILYARHAEAQYLVIREILWIPSRTSMTFMKNCVSHFVETTYVESIDVSTNPNSASLAGQYRVLNEVHP